jgi:hypothetical protein
MALMAISRNVKFNIPLDFRQKELVDAQEKYRFYIDKFEEICNLEPGDKLARDTNGVYYRHIQGTYFIQLRRWWTKQGRHHTFNYLDEDFTEFMKYLDQIMNYLNITFDSRYRQFAKNLRDLANSLMTGLYRLKKTYPKEKELSCKIDSIIMSLIDFKNTIGEKLDIPIGKTKVKRNSY